ncbi:NUDIX hydrolase domain-like protein [Elaphomyces granulatus]
MSASEAIQDVPLELSSLAVPLKSWLNSHQEYQHLVVGAFVFAYGSKMHMHAAATNDDYNQPHLLLIKRADEDTYPRCWEMPGGSVEQEDPTILDAVAREVREETGLQLTRLVEQIGGGLVRRSKRITLRLSFEIEVNDVSNNNVDDIPVKLNPEEHQDYEWVTEEDLINGKETGKYTFMSKSLYQVLLDGFAQHKARFEQLKQGQIGDRRSKG